MLIGRYSPGTLQKFQDRAQLLTNPDAKPYAKQTLELPNMETELFFDVETDPMRDICYLHGFTERRNGDNAEERYVSFYAESTNDNDEKKAFQEAWAYIKSCQPCAVYYYSNYEERILRNLQKKYPEVASAEEIDEFISSDNTVDLYTNVVKKYTEWPTNDHSIKTLALYLGFKWRDTDPSGAASIEWYHRWVETGDASIRQRIIDYNEDDYVSTRVLLDGIRKLPTR
jgi:predicted RecB family nuclease